MNNDKDTVNPAACEENDAVSIPDAAAQLGIDAFSLYALIQQGEANPGRSSTGKLFLPTLEMERLLRGSIERF
jgi:hypothetical protein